MTGKGRVDLNEAADVAREVIAKFSEDESIDKVFIVYNEFRSVLSQRVIVEHKHYHLHQSPEAGEGGGVETETEHQPHVRSISERAAMLGNVETLGAEMQGPGGEGLVGVPVSRRTGRAA